MKKNQKTIHRVKRLYNHYHKPQFIDSIFSMSHKQFNKQFNRIFPNEELPKSEKGSHYLNVLKMLFSFERLLPSSNEMPIPEIVSESNFALTPDRFEMILNSGLHFVRLLPN